MRTLKFIVKGQKLKKDTACDFKNIVPGSTGYLRVQFAFDSAWNGMVKAAEFRIFGKSGAYPVLIQNGGCNVPDEVASAKMWSILVIGKSGDKRLPTNKVTVVQEG